MGDTAEREPTKDELAGIAWWSNLPEEQRAHWATRAGTGVVADAWNLFKASQYRITSAELQTAVSEARVVSSTHADLLRAIRRVPGYAKAALVRIEDIGSSLLRRKVLRPDGSLVDDDHQQWLQGELEADAGQVTACRQRLAGLDLRLSRCGLTTLRIICDRAGDQANVTQVTVEVHTQTLDRRLFGLGHHSSTPRDLRELVEDAVGPEVPAEERVSIAAPCYNLREIVNIGTFVRTAQAIHHERQLAASRLTFDVSEVKLGGAAKRSTVMTGAELDPQWDRFPCKERRIFNDWTLSSAGRSGARLCDHWAFRISDGFMEGQRYMSFVTEWSTNRKIRRIDSRKLNDYELFGKLQALDERVGVPFAWFFFMLHGNRIQSEVGHRVLTSAEAGRILLPEHDYRVLKNWCERQYGF